MNLYGELQSIRIIWQRLLKLFLYFYDFLHFPRNINDGQQIKGHKFSISVINCLHQLFKLLGGHLNFRTFKCLKPKSFPPEIKSRKQTARLPVLFMQHVVPDQDEEVLIVIALK